MIKVSRHSAFTGIQHLRDLDITHQQLAAYDAGALIQDAFPSLSDMDREFLMTGVTPEECDRYILGITDETTRLVHEALHARFVENGYPVEPWEDDRYIASEIHDVIGGDDAIPLSGAVALVTRWRDARGEAAGGRLAAG